MSTVRFTLWFRLTAWGVAEVNPPGPYKIVVADYGRVRTIRGGRGLPERDRW